MILNYLKLIRFKNLLIIALTQYLMRYAVLLPMISGFESQFSHFNFFLLVLSTVSLAAAGYAINDYFDAQTDILNRPKTVIVGEHISRNATMNLHIILNILGIALGLYVSYSIHLWKLVYIYVFISGLLWFYSTSFKRQFLIGNVIIALLTAIVPLMPVLYEIPPLNAFYREGLILAHQNFNYLFFWSAGFAIFAFITTLTRELLKDVEDFEGDKAYGRRTLPIVSGVKISKVVAVSLVSITVGLIIFAYFNYLQINFSEVLFSYISSGWVILTVLLNIFLIYKIIKADTKEDWHFTSNLSKLIMLVGVLYSILLYFNFEEFL